jgi:hypothetical protein
MSVQSWEDPSMRPHVMSKAAAKLNWKASWMEARRLASCHLASLDAAKRDRKVVPVWGVGAGQCRSGRSALSRQPDHAGVRRFVKAHEAEWAGGERE